MADSIIPGLTVDRVKGLTKLLSKTVKGTNNELEDLVGGNQLRDEARRMFNIADEDGSGTMGPIEFRSAYESMTSKMLPPSEVQEIFERIDTSGDGSVSFEEFYEWVKWQKAIPLKLRKPFIVGFVESFLTPSDDSFTIAQREKQAVGELRAAARDPRTNKADLLAEVIDNAGLQVRFYFSNSFLLFITEYFTNIMLL